MNPRSLVGEPGARRISPFVFLLVVVCFFLAFAGVSCNTDATKAGVRSLAGTGGLQTSQTSALDTCLDALRNVNMLSYTGWALVFGQDPSIPSLPPACDTGTSVSAREPHPGESRPPGLCHARAGLRRVGVALGRCGVFGIIRPRSRAIAAISFAVATGALLFLDQQHVHDVLPRQDLGQRRGERSRASALPPTST